MRRGDNVRVADYLIMRGADRFVSTEPGLTSRHSFSFGRHYDPGNVGFGLLVMNNDDVVRPGAGYATHPHRDVEIVTWVLAGALAHRDSTGAGGVIHPGLAQRLSAGRGVEHSEFNDDAAPGGIDGLEAPLRFVQMWLPPGERGVDPSYEQRDVTADLAGGRLITVASGMRRHAGTAAIGLGQDAAAMHVARLTASAAVTLPGAPFVHLYVARGAVNVEGVGSLREGDAVRLTDEGGRRVHAVVDQDSRDAPEHGSPDRDGRDRDNHERGDRDGRDRDAPEHGDQDRDSRDRDAPKHGERAAAAEIIAWEMHTDVAPATPRFVT